MPPILAELQAAWAAEFPGASMLILVLRNALAFADWHARHIQFNFHQLHNDLRLTGLPMHLWHPCTRQTYQFMERANARAQREFRQALRALQSSYKKPEPVKPPPPPPEPPEKLHFFQSLYVTVEDGVVKTTTEMDAAFMCAIPPEALEIIGWFVRQFSFKNGVPACYAGLLTHQGVTYEPQSALLISYPKDDFLRLCRQELATASPHVLDDEASRASYHWNPGLPTTGENK